MYLLTCELHFKRILIILETPESSLNRLYPTPTTPSLWDSPFLPPSAAGHHSHTHPSTRGSELFSRGADHAPRSLWNPHRWYLRTRSGPIPEASLLRLPGIPAPSAPTASPQASRAAGHLHLEVHREPLSQTLPVPGVPSTPGKCLGHSKCWRIPVERTNDSIKQLRLCLPNKLFNQHASGA